MTPRHWAISRLVVAVGILASSGTFCLVNLHRGGNSHDADDGNGGYKISELVYMGATHTFSYLGFNNLGHAAGSIWDKQGRYVAALYDGKDVHTIGTLPGDFGSRVYGMNDRDVVVGSSYKNDNHYSLRSTRAFIWDGKALHGLPPVAGVPFSRAWAVNGLSDVVGNSYKPFDEQRDADSIPTLWRDRVPVALPLPSGAVRGIAYSINDAGIIVGNVVLADGTTRGCMWQGSKVKVLDPLPGDKSTTASSVNSHGDVLAESLGNANRVEVWDGTKCDVLGTMSGVAKLQAVKINDSGEIVLNDPDTPGYPILWRRDKGFIRISHLLPVKSGYSLWKGMGLNNSGQIAVGGRYAGTRTSVFLLSPPESVGGSLRASRE